MNKVGCPACLFPGLCLWPEELMGCISCLVIAVLQIVGSKNKAGLTFSFLLFIAVGSLAESKLLDIYAPRPVTDTALFDPIL